MTGYSGELPSSSTEERPRSHLLDPMSKRSAQKTEYIAKTPTESHGVANIFDYHLLDAASSRSPSQ